MFVPLTLAISRIHVFPNSQIANIIGHQSLALHPPSYVCHRVAYARKSDATRSWCTQLAAPAPPDVARRLSGGPPQTAKLRECPQRKWWFSPGFCGQNMSKFRSVWGTPKRGCQGLNMTSIWGLVNFDAVVNHRSCKFPVEKEHLWHVPKWICLSLFFCQLDAFLINSHSQTRSIYIFGDKTQCPGTLSNTLWSPVPRLDTPCPPPAQSNSSSRAALTWQMMAVSHQKSWWLRGLKQPVVEIWSFSCRAWLLFTPLGSSLERTSCRKPPGSKLLKMLPSFPASLKYQFLGQEVSN